MNNQKMSIRQLIQRMNELVGDLQGELGSPKEVQPVLQKFDQYVPLLEEIYNGMQANTESMTEVSDRLKSADKLTGEAVGRILDCTDSISNRLISIQQEFEKLSSEAPVQELETILMKLRERLPADKDVQKANNIFAKSVRGMFDKRRETIKNELAKVQEMANQIMLEMQFHDITSQQLGSANYLLLKAYMELRELLQEKTSHVESDLDLSDDHLNHNAGDEASTLEQDMTDKLIQQFQTGEVKKK